MNVTVIVGLALTLWPVWAHLPLLDARANVRQVAAGVAPLNRLTSVHEWATEQTGSEQAANSRIAYWIWNDCIVGSYERV
jgi:hypothetical protein